MPLTLVILAAGIGSRYGGIKQMDPVGPAGELVLDYSVFDALRAGFDRVVFVVSRAIEADFRAVIGARLEEHVAVEYVRQELSDLPTGYSVPAGRQKPWGTAHAVLTAAGAVDGPFVSANADDFYGRDTYAALARFLGETAADESRYAMVGFVLRNTLSEHGSVARGICEADADGTLRAVVEHTHIELRDGSILCPGRALTGDELVSMNIWGLKPSVFGHLRDEFRRFLAERGGDLKAEFFLPTVINALIARGTASVAVLPTNSAWFGMTHARDKAAVVARIRALVERGEYPPDLWATPPKAPRP